MTTTHSPSGAGFAAPESGDAQAVGTGLGIKGQAEAESPNRTDDGATSQTSKALSTVRASLALKGYELRDLAGGGWLICRWNMAREARDMDAVEAFARQVGARA